MAFSGVVDHARAGGDEPEGADAAGSAMREFDYAVRLDWPVFGFAHGGDVLSRARLWFSRPYTHRASTFAARWISVRVARRAIEALVDCSALS